MSNDYGIDLKDNEEGSALLVGVYTGSAGRQICEEHLDELESLADTFGVPSVGRVLCAVRKFDASTYIGEGKLQEIAESIIQNKATLVIFDEEITPAQQRNLEKLLKVAVMDRTELILEIFAERAHTREAKLQIELAQTQYEFPRLKRLWSHFSRQRASGGYLRGSGEKQIEVDRRLLKKRIEKLTHELSEVKRYRQTQRQARKRAGIPTFALVGYTNAGKSTLLNALTEADVFVEDKLFATLDPTTRKLTLPNHQEVLLTDTVGFIRKLPHTLVAAFKSTLEAALGDDVLIHVIDASHTMALEHAEATYQLLKELGAEGRPIITALNKVDACSDRRIIDQLRLRYTKTVLVSAMKHEGFGDLLQMMERELAERRQQIRVKIPQKEYALVSQIRREGRVIYEEYEESDVVILAEIPVNLLYQFERFVLE